MGLLVDGQFSSHWQFHVQLKYKQPYADGGVQIMRTNYVYSHTFDLFVLLTTNYWLLWILFSVLY